MSSSTALSLVAIAVAAVLAPLLSEALSGWRIPSVLFELGLGIVIGPAVLGWAEIDQFVGGLDVLGLSFLFFLAGYEINFAELKGPPLNRGLVSWGITLALAGVVGAVLAIEGFVVSSLLVGLCLTTTALGTLMPMLRDRELMHGRFGSFISAGGAIGEFAPVLAVTILLSADSPVHEMLLLIAFVVVAVVFAVVAARPQPPRFLEMMERHLSTSTQLPVRVILLLVTLMVALAAELGLDSLLGAFSAGLIARVALRQQRTETLMPRLESIGYGFLIPVFFIVSGMSFDLDSLIDSPATIGRMFIFLGLMLVVRGGPALFVYRRVLSGRERSALAILQATALPLLVVITRIGLDSGRMHQDNATALVGAGMLSVLVFPLVGFRVLGAQQPEEIGEGTPEHPGPARA